VLLRHQHGIGGRLRMAPVAGRSCCGRDFKRPTKWTAMRLYLKTAWDRPCDLGAHARFARFLVLWQSSFKSLVTDPCREFCCCLLEPHAVRAMADSEAFGESEEMPSASEADFAVGRVPRAIWRAACSERGRSFQRVVSVRLLEVRVAKGAAAKAGETRCRM